MKKYYAVIDTNVLVSAMLKTNSIPGKLLDLVLYENVIIPLVSDDILKEYKEVLYRNKFGFSSNKVFETINNFIAKSIFIDRKKTLEEFIDKDDIVFFEVALSGRSTMDAYLVTGNIKHYPIKNFVVTPREMLEIIKKDRNSNPI